MADDVLARATVAVSANVKDFDAAMDLLPGKSQKAIKKSIDAIKAEMAKVSQALGSASSPADVKKLTDYYNQLSKSLDGVKKSAIGQAAALGPASKALNSVGSAAAMNGNKMQVLAQGLDDLQYVPEMGLRPILNNLIQLSPALGVAGLALQQLITHWDQLVSAFGGGAVKTVAQEMEELRKKTELTATEFERLGRADAIKGKVTELRGIKTEDQQSEEAAATRAIAEAGFKDVVAGFRKTDQGKAIIDSQGEAAVVAGKIKAQEDIIAKHEGLKSSDTTGQVFGIIGKAEKEIARLKLDELENARNITAESKVAQAAIIESLGGRRKEFIEMVRANPAAFGGGDAKKGQALIKALELADPAAMKAAASDKFYDAQEQDQRDRDVKKDEDERYRQLGLDQAKVAPLQERMIMPGLMELIAMGNKVSQEELAATIERKLEGFDIKDRKSVASNMAHQSIQGSEAALAKRQIEKGGTREEAALAMAAENVERLRNEANRNRPSYGVTDIEGFHREATNSLLNGNPNEALVNEQKRATDAYIKAQENLKNLTDAIKKKEPGLVLK